MTTVLMTADTVGGVWTYSLDLADALAAQDVEVVLAIMGPPPTAEQAQELAASAVVTSVHRHCALEWMDDPWHDVDAAGDWLLALADEHRPDVVHVNGFAHGALGWPSPVVVVAHSDVIGWWRAVHGTGPGTDRDTYAQRVQRGLDAADLVVAPTAAALADTRRSFTLGRTTVIRNARRDHWVAPCAKEPLVLGAGRLWDAAKNVAALDAAAAMVEWPVFIAGEPAATPVCGARLLGRLPFDVLAGWMARASVFAAPARYEPFGLGILEAALSGCALVLGDIDSLRELWDGAAEFVDPDDPAALAATLDDLAHAPDWCAHLGHRARRRARTFRPASMAHQYATEYRRLTERAGASA